MKNIVGAINGDEIYTCNSTPNGGCSNSAGGICGNIGKMGVCKVSGSIQYEYDASGNYSIKDDFLCYCDTGM